MASNPLSTVSDAVFENILEQCIYELVYEAHREDKQASSACQICLKKCRCYVVKPSLDIFGNAPTPATLEKLKCIKCSTLFPTNRYAAHLEKCLGLGGRRAASRSVNKKHLMPNQSSPTLNDSDQEDHHSGVKKKRSDSPARDVLINKHVKVEHNDGSHIHANNTIKLISSNNLTRQNTPLSSNAYLGSRETTPVISSASLPGSRATASVAGMFAGKTKPGIGGNALMAKNSVPSSAVATAGKVPVGGYGKVPRVLGANPAMLTAGVDGSDSDDFEL